MGKSKRSIAFFVYPVLRFPRNNRQYYLTKELISRGWEVLWLLPESGINEGVPVDDLVFRYRDLDVRGRTYLLPLYLGLILRSKGIKYLWLSGWVITRFEELYWLVRIMRMFGIETVYDPIDPVCEFKVANGEFKSPEAIDECQRKMNSVYALCRRVLCVTPEMKSLLARNGADETRLFVARWGSDADVFVRGGSRGDYRKMLGIPDSTVIVGWLGSMTQFKGLKEMIVPMVERCSSCDNIHFLLAGGGPLFGEIEEWASAFGNSRVTLSGRPSYEEAAQFTAALDVYLVPTNPESEYARAICPVKCYDAIAMGTPLVTTRTPATEHLAGLSGNVWLCDYDLDSFTEALSDIAVNIESVRKVKTTSAKGCVTHQGVSREIASLLENLSSTR